MKKKAIIITVICVVAALAVAACCVYLAKSSQKNIIFDIEGAYETESGVTAAVEKVSDDTYKITFSDENMKELTVKHVKKASVYVLNSEKEQIMIFNAEGKYQKNGENDIVFHNENPVNFFAYELTFQKK